MKSLLFATLALSLIFMVSAQCDLNAVTTCAQNFASMVSKLGLYVGIYHCMSMHNIIIMHIYKLCIIIV